MAVESRKPLRRGLDLGVEETQTPGLVHANGARIARAGEMISRLGRVRLGLVFPTENVPGEDVLTQETIPHLRRGNLTRGFGAFYDQRLETQPQEVITEGEFITASNWTPAGDFTYASGAQAMEYQHSSGSGTLTQASAAFEVDQFGDTFFEPNTEYVLEYDFAWLAGTTTNITLLQLSGVSASPLDLPFANASGRHVLTFQSANAIADFVITANSTGTVTFQLDNLSLKRKVATITLPPRLNIVAKGLTGQIYFNNHFVGDGTRTLTGDGRLYSSFTRAKIVASSDRCFIVDESAKPRALRRLPVQNQRLYRRVKYDIRNMGIDWPRSTGERPSLVLTTAVSGEGLSPGAYRVRVALENIVGDESNPSITSYILVVESDISTPKDLQITFPPVPEDLQASFNDVTKWRVYVSYQAGAEQDDRFVLIESEPSAMHFWRSFDIGTATATFIDDDFERLADMPVLNPFKGAPPKLLDYMIVNDTAYGIANYDTVHREGLTTEGRGRIVGFSSVDLGEFFGASVPLLARNRVYDFTEIKTVPVDPGYLFIGEPGAPQYMNNWVRFAEGDEIGVGLSHVGKQIVVFTNKGIVTWDPESRRLSRAPAEVGALARDSIQRTEKGIRFMGSDGVPRLFNGVTVDEVSDELLPIFDQEDYDGSYLRFDRTFARDVSVASGDRSFWMNYPVSSNPGKTPDPRAINFSGKRNLAIGETSQSGRSAWAIDDPADPGYEQIVWLGREGRLAAVDTNGDFYYIEEGFEDERVSGVSSLPPRFEWTFRWFGDERGRKARFHVVRFEIDTQGTTVAAVMRLNGDSLQGIQAFSMNSTRRQHFRARLPATFKGLYLEIRLLGATDSIKGRPRLYDLQVESSTMGNF